MISFLRMISTLLLFDHEILPVIQKWNKLLKNVCWADGGFKKLRMDLFSTAATCFKSEKLLSCIPVFQVPVVQVSSFYFKFKCYDIEKDIFLVDRIFIEFRILRCLLSR